MNNTDFDQKILQEISRINLQDDEHSVNVLNNFLDSLSSSNRKVFVKRYYYNDTIQDIATAMSLSEHNVKTILTRTCGELEVYIYTNGLSSYAEGSENDSQNVLNIIKNCISIIYHISCKV